MAKKIRLDFSKVEERTGWNTKAIPEGLHAAKIVDVTVTEAGDGTAMWVYALVPTDPRYKARRFPFYCKLQQNQLWKLRDVYVAAGIEVPKKVVQLDPEKPVGAEIAIEVSDETNAQYAGRSVVDSVYGIDILGDVATDDDSDADDDDDEYDGDEDEADESPEADDDEDEEDDEDEVDYESMSLAELRKAAKAEGIDTAGLKKAELIEALTEEDEDDEDSDDEDEDELEDDDLGDDEDDDEYEDDEEDEEEEPEPAPKKRAAAKKAPAAKAPAPKASAAKRTVKRR